MDCSRSSFLFITKSWSLFKLMSIELVMPFYHLNLCILFASCFQSFPASGYFQMSQFFASGGQSIGTSASVSVLPMNIQDWFLLGWTGLFSFQSRGLSRIFFTTTISKALILLCSALFMVQLSHPYMATGEIIALTKWILVSKVMSLLFNMLSAWS